MRPRSLIMRRLCWKGVFFSGCIVTLLSAETASQCYRIDKHYIHTNLKPKESVIVNIHSLYTHPQQDAERNLTKGDVDIVFDTPRYIRWAGNAYLHCAKEANETVFYCGGDDDGGHMSIMKKPDGIYFKIEGARISETTADPIIYEIEGKSEAFIKGEPVSCFRSFDAIVKVHNYEQDPLKAQLLSSLSKLKDMIIYAIDYNDKVAIAVGEGNSIETRKAYSKDEYHKALTLYSFDKGKHWYRNGGNNDTIPYHSVKLVKGKRAVACGTMEGTGGEIAMTENGGKRWTRVYSGGFLNSITVQKNSFFAAGYGILKSDDGIHWNRVYRNEHQELRAITTIDNKRVLAVGDELIIFSDDKGKSWHKATFLNDASAQWAREIYQKDGKIYVVMGDPDFGIIVSYDKGKSWQYADNAYIEKLKEGFYHDK